MNLSGVKQEPYYRNELIDWIPTEWDGINKCEKYKKRKAKELEDELADDDLVSCWFWTARRLPADETMRSRVSINARGRVETW